MSFFHSVILFSGRLPCVSGIRFLHVTRLSRTLHLHLTYSDLPCSYLPYIKCLNFSAMPKNGSASTMEEHIDRFEYPADVLSLWQEHRATLPPAVTLKCLIKAIHLIRIQKDYSMLSLPTFKLLLRSSLSNTSDLDAEDLVTLLWLMAKLKWVNHTILNSLSKALGSKVSELSDKSLGLVPWSLVNLKVTDNHRSLMKLVLNQASHRLEQGLLKDSRALANICWSLSTSKTWPDSFTSLVNQFLKAEGDKMSSHTLSLFLHSLSKAGALKSERWLFDTVSNSVSSFKSIDSQSLILILWSIGNAKKYDRKFFESLTEEILSENLVGKYNPRVLATLLWCCAKVQYYNRDLLDHLSEQIPNFVDQMTLQDLSMVGYSFGYLNYPCPGLIRTIVNRVMTHHAWKPNVPFQALLNLSWACLINEVYPRDLLDLCLSEKIIKYHVMKDKPQKSLYIHQLLQLDLACRLEQPQMNLPLLSPSNRLHLLLDAVTLTMKYESKFHRVVAEVLTSIFGCVDYLNMETISFSGYALDFELLLDKTEKLVSVPNVNKCTELNLEEIKKIYARMLRNEGIENRELDLKGFKLNTKMTYNLSTDWYEQGSHVERRIAIEVDGPPHFAVNCPHPLGKTALKQRQLRAFGWDVISVPFFEWEEFGLHGKEQMAMYLRDKIFSKK